MARILIATKDRQAGRVLAAVADTLREHEVHIFAEGLSKKVWKQEGYNLAFEGPDSPAKESPTQAPFADAAADLILVGTSAPPGIEASAARFANEHGIPLAVFADTWGAVARLHAYPDLLLALDDLEGKIEEGRRPGMRVVVVGDPMLEEIEAIQRSVPRALNEKILIERSLGHRILLVVGQGAAYTPAMLRVARDCVLKSTGWRVIPRILHPKNPDPALAQAWGQISAGLNGRILDTDAAWSTDHIAAVADATISVFSTVLRVAAHSGRVALSVSTPETRQGMYQSTSLPYYPPTLSGLVQEIKGPVELDGLEPSASEPDNRFSPAAAQEAIEALIKTPVW